MYFVTICDVPAESKYSKQRCAISMFCMPLAHSVELRLIFPGYLHCFIVFKCITHIMCIAVFFIMSNTHSDILIGRQSLGIQSCTFAFVSVWIIHG